MPENLNFKTCQLIRELASTHFNKVRQVRRDLHQHPELSGEESWTAGYLCDLLNHLGLDVKNNFGGHGIVADLIVDPAKPTVALRLDMDALPIHEINNVSYRSQFPGVMHACGHDVHSAIGIGVAGILTKMADKLPGNIRFIFQPEEEEITGALRMIHAGALRNPTPIGIIGLHVAPIQAGNIAWTDNLFLAGFDHFLCSIAPQPGRQITPQHLDTIADRCCSIIQGFNKWQLPETWESMQILWQKMQQGPPELRNFITYDATRNDEDPDAWHGQFGLGIKAANPHLRRAALGRVRAAVNTICQITHTRYHIDHLASMQDMQNDPQLVRCTIPALEMAIGAADLLQLQAAFPFNCEDFAYYTKYIPGGMYWLGAADPAHGKYAMLHTPDFDVDESCLETGMVAISAILLALLQSHPT
jgi:amidohydrolase